MKLPGYFYIVQLLPDVAPNRLKLGYTTDPAQRLRSHQTTCPHARILKTWPCHSQIEQRAIAYLTKYGCEQLGKEVFTCNDFPRLLRRAELFFEQVVAGKIRPPTVKRIQTAPRKVSPATLERINAYKARLAEVGKQTRAICDAIEHKQPYYSVEEAATILNRKPSTIRTWMQPNRKTWPRLSVSSDDRRRGRYRAKSKEVASLKFTTVYNELLKGQPQNEQAG